MIHLFTYLYSCIDNDYVLFIVTLFAFCFKLLLLGLLIYNSVHTPKNVRPWSLLAIIATCASFIDLSWLLYLFSSFTSHILYTIRLLVVRFAWLAVIVQYQALGIFVERLTSNRNKINLYQKIFCGINIAFAVVLCGFTIKDFNCATNEERSIIEIFARNIGAAFALFVTLVSCIVAIRTIRTEQLPRLIKKQLTTLIQFLIAPIWISDFFQLFPLAFSTNWLTNSYAAFSITTLLITYAMYHCMRKVMALRFLNFSDSVQTISRFNFIEGFKDILEQLSRATTVHELNHITQNSFKEAFSIPIGRTHLYIRQSNSAENSVKQEPLAVIESTVEGFMSSCGGSVIEFIQKTKVLTTDELAFSNFYEPIEERTIILKFLDQINADIFIPIYEKNILIAYIVIDRLSRSDEFFSNIEQDEMLVFSNYLGNIINLIQNRNLESLIHREKELQEELFSKHQEINQYKESIRSFVTNKQHKDIGIIFFKNRHFSFGNQAAKELIGINLNLQHGHPLSKTLRTLVRNIQEYKTPQTCITKDAKGNRLVFSGMPSIEKNNVIITAYYPDISDLIKRHVDAIKDPTNWDYLLYLETTASGRLINELIPGAGEMILQSKITLLKAALSKKALLLEVAPDDLMPIVEIIHHISLRETLHVIKLQGPSKNNELAIKLFGINPIFAPSNQEKPLLEKLSDSGTLYIQNVQYLTLETQEYLAEYIKYGSWRIYKSEQRMSSQVRVVCSTNQNLSSLVQEGLFSKELYSELKKHVVSIPSLLTLPENELEELTTEYTEQAIISNDFKSLLELSDKERHHIINQRPISFHELKTKIQNMLTQKSRKNKIQNDITFDNIHPIGDPEVIQAVRLGKHALRDPKIMSLLWHKFKSQTKIASLLGVNRSSVNRRCKDYILE